MEDRRKYDLIVFGASGFTGQYTVDEVARVAQEENLTWAVAGRSLQKLQKVLSETSARSGQNLEGTPIIIADTSSPASLEDMASQGKVVLNCVGPYRFYGEPVVKACIEAGAHHLDISGESQFLEKMQLLFDAKAREKNVFVIGSTGFDSIPAEMGILYTMRQFKDGELTNVENYLTAHSGQEGMAMNIGTFESAIYWFAHMKELPPLQQSLFPEPMPKVEHPLPKRRAIFYSQEVNGWCLPFHGTDESVFYRTVRESLKNGRLKKPIEFQPYLCVANLLQLLGLLVFGVIFGLLASFSLGRSLLLKYPHVFSFGFFKKGGPTRKQIEGTSFTMTFVGYGLDQDQTSPTKKVVTRILAPEPAYVTTPICMTQAAVTLLKEQHKIQHKGGVLTPGAAFWDTNLISRLEKHNVKFVTLSNTGNMDRV